jgi:hypothetical protein
MIIYKNLTLDEKKNNRHIIDEYYSHYENRPFLPYDSIFKELNHKICIMYNHKKYWLSTIYGFKKFEKLSNHCYKITLLNDNITYINYQLNFVNKYSYRELKKYKNVYDYIEIKNKINILLLFDICIDVIRLMGKLYIELYDSDLKNIYYK